MALPVPVQNALQGGVTYLDGQSVYYQVVVNSLRHGTVFAWLPDEFAMNLTENWNFIVGGGLPALGTLGAEWFRSGAAPTNQTLTAQLWSGSSPLRFSLPLHFVARRNSTSEVINPIKILMKATLPRLKNGSGSSLIPPGASIFNLQQVAADDITLWIGSYLRIPDIFIENIDVRFKGKLDTQGNPMEGEATIRCATLYAPVAEDVDTYINAGAGNVGRPASNAPFLNF